MATINDFMKEGITMSARSFRSVPGAVVIPLSCLLTSAISSGMLILCFYDEQTGIFVLLSYSFFIIAGLVGAILSSQQALCSVILYNDYVLCKIPFAKNVEIAYDKCYIGMDYHVQGGGKIWWIYFSYGKMPPYKNPQLGNRINSIKCQTGFVRIMYCDEVYNALLEVLPQKQKTALLSARRCAGF